MQSINM